MPVPQQIHMVNYKEEYGSVESAMMRRDGLAVIGILLSSFRGDSNTQLQDMVHSIQNLQGVGEFSCSSDLASGGGSVVRAPES